MNSKGVNPNPTLSGGEGPERVLGKGTVREGRLEKGNEGRTQEIETEGRKSDQQRPRNRESNKAQI